MTREDEKDAKRWRAFTGGVAMTREDEKDAKRWRAFRAARDAARLLVLIGLVDGRPNELFYIAGEGYTFPEEGKHPTLDSIADALVAEEDAKTQAAMEQGGE